MNRIRTEHLQKLTFHFRRTYKELMCLALGAASFALGTTLLAQSSPADPLPPGGVKLQIVTFGDSLEDAGTYSPFARKNFGGGLFTTNPSPIWTQQVAAYYGDDLKPAFVGGFGQPLQPAGGLGFAQGGSRVALRPGVGYAPAGTPNADFALQTTVPVADQLNQFLSKYGKFQPDQLVLFDGGANDLLFNLQNAESDRLKLPGALINIDKAAADLADIVDKAIHAGAKHVVLLNLADFGMSPEGVSSKQGPLITAAVKTFNDTLKATLLIKGDLDKVILIDEFSFLDQVVADFQNYGFTTSDTGVACDAQAEIAIAAKLKLSNPSFFSDSLFCSPQTLVVPGADQTFIFADSVHPTAHYSDIFAHFVERQIAASGLGQ
jgi:phospholipase/lecithinase/hemolysin